MQGGRLKRSWLDGDEGANGQGALCRARPVTMDILREGGSFVTWLKTMLRHCWGKGDNIRCRRWISKQQQQLSQFVMQAARSRLRWLASSWCKATTSLSSQPGNQQCIAGRAPGDQTA
ncbi:hypothetical protein ACJRO7_015694 [Eucalyptus globulus]|uniref:Uncharacterized protein n=1 Tax=Eucalyptus globulus TaxID=34317 RepID=A0ABD3L4I7_EUCGL